MNMSNQFPKMIEMGQSYPPSQKLDFSSLLEEQFTQTGLREKIKPGMSIALGVGSRGITNLKEIVKATLGVLIKAGARPFIVPAMGATAEPLQRARSRCWPGTESPPRAWASPSKPAWK